MAKHYPPAYYRYRETHKTISVVVSEKLKETLDDLRGERSYADFLREAFKPGGLMEQIQKDTTELLRLEARRDAFERNVKALADA
ncbi:MAG: hypothetical protein Q8O76_02235, partial [Chloroflexota bacterium]|nr:hypothetical protein [Chloroflexota bacterium]